MAKLRRPWLRLYTEAAHDWKVQRLTPAERWVWIATLCAAREFSRSGLLQDSDSIRFSREDLARYASVTNATAERAIKKMLDLGLLGYSEQEECYYVPAWAERQFESDSSTERVAKSRYMQQRIVADSNTPQRQRQRQSNYARSRKAGDSEELEAEFASLWEKYPRKLARRGALDAYCARRRAGVPADELARALENFATAMRRERRQAEHVMYGSTFFGPHERWKDYLEAPPESQPIDYEPDVQIV